MIRHVYERVSRAQHINRVIVATDDQRIYDCVEGFGGEAVMPSGDYRSGTDRIAAAAELIEESDLILNVQGDEPMIEPELLDRLIEEFRDTPFDCATPVTSLTTPDQLFDPSIVKVVLRTDSTALYFSRSPVPFIRDKDPETWPTAHQFYRHIGVYLFRHDTLKHFVSLPYGILEQAEQLEQLRLLEHGHSILCVKTDYTSYSVDTPEDVMHVEQLLAEEAS